MQHQTCHGKVLAGIWAEGAWAFACVNSISHISQAWGDEGHWGRALESTQTQLTVVSEKGKIAPYFRCSFLTKNNRRKVSILKYHSANSHSLPDHLHLWDNYSAVPPAAAMWTLLTHSTSLPLCRTGTGMCFSYSLKPPSQTDSGCHWKKKNSVSNTQIFTPSGSAESDRRGQKCTFNSDLCTNSTVWGNMNERTADNSSWQKHSIPILSSTNEFREYEKKAGNESLSYSLG